MDIVKYVELLAWALEQIGRLTKNPLDDEAPAVVRAIYAIYKSLTAASTGKVTPEKARKEIEKTLAGLADNDAAADDKLKKKFGR